MFRWELNEGGRFGAYYRVARPCNRKQSCPKEPINGVVPPCSDTAVSDKCAFRGEPQGAAVFGWHVVAGVGNAAPAPRIKIVLKACVNGVPAACWPAVNGRPAGCKSGASVNAAGKTCAASGEDACNDDNPAGVALSSAGRCTLCTLLYRVHPRI